MSELREYYDRAHAIELRRAELAAKIEAMLVRIATPLIMVPRWRLESDNDSRSGGNNDSCRPYGVE